MVIIVFTDVAFIFESNIVRNNISLSIKHILSVIGFKRGFHYFLSFLHKFLAHNSSCVLSFIISFSFLASSGSFSVFISPTL